MRSGSSKEYSITNKSFGMASDLSSMLGCWSQFSSDNQQDTSYHKLHLKPVSLATNTTQCSGIRVERCFCALLKRFCIPLTEYFWQFSKLFIRHSPLSLMGICGTMVPSLRLTVIKKGGRNPSLYHRALPRGNTSSGNTKLSCG